MQLSKKRLSLLLASSFGTAVLVVAPVWADHGSDSTSSSGDSGSSSSGSATSGQETEQQTTTETETKDTAEATAGIHEQAKQLLAQQRQNGKQKSTADRQKACQAHQTEINKRVSNYAKSAQKHLDTFNAIFTKVQAFHDSKGLTVANYDTLVAAAKTKQTAAQTAVDALAALNVKIDCSQSDPASSVASVKVAVKNARTTLQDYRKSIKDIVVALKGASTAQSNTEDKTSTSTGGNQ